MEPDPRLMKAADDFVEEVNMKLREIELMEEEAAVTQDAALMARANDGFNRLYAIVFETGDAITRIQDAARREG